MKRADGQVHFSPGIFIVQGKGPKLNCLQIQDGCQGQRSWLGGRKELHKHEEGWLWPPTPEGTKEKHEDWDHVAGMGQQLISSSHQVQMWG
jgi:hypothetical protein